MKQLIKPTLVILFAMSFTCAFSQAGSSAKVGLYKNEDDFNMHKLTFELDCKSKQDAIKTNGFFESPKVTVTINNKKYVVLKKDFFGYHDCKGNDYRFYQNKMFEIVDTVSFYVYKHTALEPGAGGKGYATITKYYFSKKGDGPLRSLTVKALSDAFPENAKFRYALESYAHNDHGLMDYDPYLKSYKLKYLFAESVK